MHESDRENRIESYPHWPCDGWAPLLPRGRIERIYTHWSGNDYQSVFPAYHFCIATDPRDGIVVVQTHDVRENMRDVRQAPDSSYAAHTRGRNSYALGVSIMAMQGATPEDFGSYPLTPALVDALCRVCARLAHAYDVPIDPGHVMSHAEAALQDGYFGASPEQRWDIARLRPEAAPLRPEDALATGEELRTRMRRVMAALRSAN